MDDTYSIKNVLIFILLIERFKTKWIEIGKD